MTTLLNREERQRPIVPLKGERGWRQLTIFGLALTVIGIGQLAFYMFPKLGFGSPEWEFGVSAQILNGLPLAVLGAGVLYAAAAGTANRTGLIALAVLFAVMALIVLGLLGLFWTVAPVALKGSPALVRNSLIQTIVRTTLSGLGFGLLFLWGAWVAARQVKLSN